MRMAVLACLFTLILSTTFVVLTLSQGDNSKVLVSRSDTKDYKAKSHITHKCFLDISIQNNYHGRIVIGLFGDDVPFTV